MMPADRLSPTAAADRIDLLDALRGFALLGIMFVNMTWFTGFAVLSPDERAALGSPAIDGLVGLLISVLVGDKFWSLFALMFGVGFAIQVRRAEQRGVDAAAFMQRRMAALFAIGAAHAVFVWFGDIVSLYAVVGVVVLLFRSVQDRNLIRWALLMLLLSIPWAILVFGVDSAMHDPDVARVDPGYGPPGLLVFFGNGGYAETFRANWAYLVDRWILAALEGRFFKLLGMFLLGFLVGRRRILEDPVAHERLLRRTVFWGLLIGLPLNVAAAFIGADLPIRIPTGPGCLVAAIRSICVPALCLAYAAGFALLYQSPGVRRWMSVLRPPGRMSLTVYVTQSIIGVAVFYGYGLGAWGSVGAMNLVLIVLAVFGVQMLLSALWLRRFRYGPLEWVWRRMTYGAIR